MILKKNDMQFKWKKEFKIKQLEPTIALNCKLASPLKHQAIIDPFIHRFNFNYAIQLQKSDFISLSSKRILLSYFK